MTLNCIIIDDEPLAADLLASSHIQLVNANTLGKK